MGKVTGISWAHHTFNPWWGCQRVSTGCEHCYAEAFAARLGQKLWGPAKTTPRKLMSKAYWRQPVKWNAAAEKAGERRRVFSGSMCDVFEDHPHVRDARERLFELIARTPALDWLLLTKRPENIYDMLPHEWWTDGDNVWLGTSVENQSTARERVFELTRNTCYARRLFLSCEPLLGPLDLASLHYHSGEPVLHDIDWVIVGAESGKDRRPFDLAWARDLKRQCDAHGAKFFFKQTSALKPGCLDGVPDDLLIQEVPE